VDVRVPSSEKLEQLDIAKDGTTLRIVKDRINYKSPLNDQGVLSKTFPGDLASTLQYAQGFGDPSLRQWAKEHVRVHDISFGELKCSDSTFTAIRRLGFDTYNWQYHVI
jgi:hypothetical protein